MNTKLHELKSNIIEGGDGFVRFAGKMLKVGGFEMQKDVTTLCQRLHLV